MYPISSTVLDLLRTSNRQRITMTVSPVSGSQFTITESDIVQGSLSIDRYSVAGEAIEIGSVCASELKFNLVNHDGRYNNVRFEGAEIYAVLNVKEVGGTDNNYIPLGYFTVDVLPRKLSTISITALDRMMHFQKEYKNTLVYPASIREIIQNACTACNVTISTNLTSLPNYNFRVESAPTGDGITYRDILRWCCEITGTCAYMDWTGQLRLEWYHYPEFELVTGDRFTEGNDINETDMRISKIQVVDGEEITVIGETTGNYTISIVGNQLMQGNIRSLNYNNVLGTAYRPFSCLTKAFPHLYPLDRILHVDRDGNRIQTIATHVNWKFHGRTTLQGKGVSETISGYAAVNSLTDRERNIIGSIVQTAVGDIDIDTSEINEQLTQMEQATLLLNQMMFGSLGLYFTTIEGTDGDRFTYAHDKPTLEASKTIYTMRASGFAYTNTGWDDGNPVWLYGFTENGNAIYRALAVFELSADLITAGTMTADHIKGGSLVLGGANNQNGILQLKNAAGTVIVQADNNGLQASNAVITGGSISLPASNQDEGKITTSYGSYYSQLRPYGLIVDGYYSGQRYYVAINPAAINISALTAGGVVQGGASLSFDPVMYGATQSLVRGAYGIFDTQVKLTDKTNWTQVALSGSALSLGTTPNSEIMNTITGQFRAGPPFSSFSVMQVGQIVATQSKSKAEETENYGTRLVYCYEMPSPMYGDIGGGQTDENGICYVYLDPVFYETLENVFEYYVFLQKYGEGDIYVYEISREYFIVKGTPNLKFAWELKGKQKGFGIDRMEEYDLKNNKNRYDEELPSQNDMIYDSIATEILSEYEKELGL